MRYFVTFFLFCETLKLSLTRSRGERLRRSESLPAWLGDESLERFDLAMTVFHHWIVARYDRYMKSVDHTSSKRIIWSHYDTFEEYFNDFKRTFSKVDWQKRRDDYKKKLHSLSF
jgi:hypothetical protein